MVEVEVNIIAIAVSLKLIAHFVELLTQLQTAALNMHLVIVAELGRHDVVTIDEYCQAGAVGYDVRCDLYALCLLLLPHYLVLSFGLDVLP